MRNLSSLLRRRGFNVVEDCCCRTQQSKLGPIPWFHSQMMELNSGRVVLVLTHLALERARQWAQRGRTKEEEGDHPHSAVFTACLFHIDCDAQLQKTRERFVLVTFDSDSCRKSQLPKPLLGLRLFRLPLQIKALLKELTVGGRARGTQRCRSPHPDQAWEEAFASPVMLWLLLLLPSADWQHLCVLITAVPGVCVHSKVWLEKSEFYQH